MCIALIDQPFHSIKGPNSSFLHERSVPRSRRQITASANCSGALEIGKKKRNYVYPGCMPEKEDLVKEAEQCC